MSITPVSSFDALGEAWRALEAEAADHSFFQSWTWVGCLAEERYTDPVLMRAEANGRILGLALSNRRRGRLFLAESGDAALDAPFVEHNGPLLARGAGEETLQGLLGAAWRAGTRRLVLSGVAPEVLRAAGGAPLRLQARSAPLVDLGAVRRAGGDYLATLSANTRYQIRRSARRYGARGEVALGRAATEDEALAWLDALAALHGRAWRSRGERGAFASAFALRFHRALVRRAMARGEVDMLRVTAGPSVVGHLYNFRLRGRVYAYQSGLDLADAGAHDKPGLVCHALAVQRSVASEDRSYDFLAGADRYKLSLANAASPLLWAETVRPWSLLGVAASLKGALRGAAERWPRRRGGEAGAVRRTTAADRRRLGWI